MPGRTCQNLGRDAHPIIFGFELWQNSIFGIVQNFHHFFVVDNGHQALILNFLSPDYHSETLPQSKTYLSFSAKYLSKNELDGF